MALLHRARITPSKLDLLADWLPSRPWCAEVTGLRQLGAYRFDDPAGEVGLEAFLVQAAEGLVLHVPVTYRAAPLEGVVGAEEHLIGTLEHSVLGTRWVYDACGDPVWVTALATAVLTGGSGAEEAFVTETGSEPRPATASVAGSGTTGTEVPLVDQVVSRDDQRATVVRSDGLELVVVRVLSADPAGTGEEQTGTAQAGAGETLTGWWSDRPPTVLAHVRVT